MEPEIDQTSSNESDNAMAKKISDGNEISGSLGCCPVKKK
jgi:hypothetical protein